MRLCIPTETQDGKQAQVYGHFGSAPFFTIYDTEKDVVEIIKNGNEHHVHGMCQPLASLAGYKIDGIVVGGIGMGALNKLTTAGMRVFMAEHETVKETIAAFTAGSLKPVQPGQACAHHEHEHP